MIRDLLKPEQIIRMKKIIETDLRKDIHDRLTTHFDKVFESILWLFIHILFIVNLVE